MKSELSVNSVLQYSACTRLDGEENKNIRKQKRSSTTIIYYRIIIADLGNLFGSTSIFRARTRWECTFL